MTICLALLWQLPLISINQPSPSDDCYALALLLAPPDTPESTPTNTEWTTLQPALHRQALALQLLDRRENTLVALREFETDLNLIRWRYELLKDAPLIAECDYLPCKLTTTNHLTLNIAYRHWLEARQFCELDRLGHFKIALTQTEILYQVWSAIQDAQSEYNYITIRRTALLRLRQLLGIEAYHLHEFPPCVPIWYFSEIQ